MGEIVILGIFVADCAFRADRQPRMGETFIGHSFALGPGGKGSNQAVAAARAGAEVRFLTRLGEDAFADMAKTIWRDAGVTAEVLPDPESYTGAAYIFVDHGSGDNAIIVCPGAAARISTSDIDMWSERIRAAGIFMTQLEQPVPAARRALEIAREGGALTILNPAPATSLDDGIWPLCDFVTPNETEAEGLTGLPVASIDQARRAGDALLAKGAGCALITLGEAGAVLHSAEISEHIPAVNCGPVVETTGAGDAFNGAFAAALSRGATPLAATRYGCAAAGISVTRPGTANAMPSTAEISEVLG